MSPQGKLFANNLPFSKFGFKHRLPADRLFVLRIVSHAELSTPRDPNTKFESDKVDTLAMCPAARRATHKNTHSHPLSFKTKNLSQFDLSWQNQCFVARTEAVSISSFNFHFVFRFHLADNFCLQKDEKYKSQITQLFQLTSQQFHNAQFVFIISADNYF